MERRAGHQAPIAGSRPEGDTVSRPPPRQASCLSRHHESYKGELRRKALSSGQLSAARRMRRELTPAERKLWHALRAHRFQDLHIRRQVPMGRYIADFACLEAMLIVEIDGGQHDEARDAKRTAFLESEGFEILRFWNNDVLTNLDGVIHVVREALVRRTREE